jgi:hypothetical protein
VRMATFGGLLHMEGSYRFAHPDIVEIEWQVSPSTRRAAGSTRRGQRAARRSGRAGPR